MKLLHWASASLGGVAIAATVGGALAADLPQRPVPIPVVVAPAAPNWTGFYIGGNLGYGWSDAGNRQIGQVMSSNAAYGETAALGQAMADSATGHSHLYKNAFIIGGQVGYNYQYNSQFVLGIEGDIQGAPGNRGSARRMGTGGFTDGRNNVLYTTESTIATQLDYFATVRGRVGYLYTPSMLLYATGGLAIGEGRMGTRHHVSAAYGLTGAGGGQDVRSNTKTGWTVGGGIEYKIWQNWSVKAEYLYYHLGTGHNRVWVAQAATDGTPIASTVISTAHRFHGNIIRAGLNYQFNSASTPAPVIAKY